MRQETAAILAWILPKVGCTDQEILSGAPDRNAVSDWAAPSVAVLMNKGYMAGKTGRTLEPLSSLTRAEAIKLLESIRGNETIIREDISVKNAGEVLNNALYTDDITIEKTVGEGDVALQNLTALSHVYVLGGGTNTVSIENGYTARLVVLKSGTGGAGSVLNGAEAAAVPADVIVDDVTIGYSTTVLGGQTYTATAGGNPIFVFNRSYLLGILNAALENTFVTKIYRVSFNRGAPIEVTIRYYRLVW